MGRITFANPEFFYFLIIVPIIIVWYILKQKNTNASLRFSATIGFNFAKKTLKFYLRHIPFILRNLAIIFLIIVLARPQSTDNWENTKTEGIDIILALDISGSMLAEDFQPNRLEASKNVAIQFVSGRPDDRIGLVVFSGESFTQCPLTTDHAVLINLFADINSGMIEDGTAIGLGLANAVSRLKDSNSKSKVIILLTDGVNNQGEIAPLTAAELAQTFGIRVYTVGVGGMGTAPYPFKTAFGIQYQNMEVKIDEDVLRKIADQTDGRYFRATNNQKLVQIYREIDQLEKTKIETKQYSRKKEEFLLFALIAVSLVFVEALLKYTILRNIP